MSTWKPKRFWSSATVAALDGGWTVKLDARSVKTPAKAPLALPTAALAELIAAEWDAQTGAVRPETMPTTRMANSAIDKVRVHFAEVAEMLSEYAGTDLLCYRAEAPVELAQRQAAAWDPLLAWAAQTYDAPLRVTEGVIHVAQPPTSLAALRAVVFEQTEYQLAALHDLVAITGSLVLGLAVASGRIDAATAFDLSRIDEHWQAEQWGADEAAAEIEAGKREALAEAARFYALCQ